jgi:hypothetical protein
MRSLRGQAGLAMTTVSIGAPERYFLNAREAGKGNLRQRRMDFQQINANCFWTTFRLLN